MLPAKTLFVLGAGASKEVGLPIGSELKKEIIQRLDYRFEFGQLDRNCSGDRTLFDALIRHAGRDANPHLTACHVIRSGLALSNSIDDFIDTHTHDPLVAECGKAVITRSILEAEGKSKLFYERGHIDDTINFSSLEKTWYLGFYRLISQGIRRDKVAELFNNLTVVSFNYDRCLEHFLVHAIAANFQVEIEVAHELVSKLPLLRPYGTVGNYFGPEAVTFGANRMPPLSTVVKSLRTYTEQVEDRSALDAIKDVVGQAEVLVFLGNQFHRNNMDLLRPTRTIRKAIYATRAGISERDLGVVQDQLNQLRQLGGERGRCNFSETCFDLFDDYRMSLSHITTDQ